MRSEFSRHKLAYIVLLLGVIIFVTIFLGAWPNREIQRVIILAMALFYFLWGVLTHFKTKSINKQVVIEYGMVSVLAGLLLLIITL